MATTAGSIVVGIQADVAELKTDLSKATRELERFAGDVGTSLRSLTNWAGSFATSLAGIGLAFGGVQLAQFVKSTIDAADRIGDLSERLGVSTESLQAFQYAARDVGANAEAVESAFGKLNRTLGEAGQGSKEAIAQFQKMGVAFKDSAGYVRTTEEVVRDVADRIQRAGSVSEATAIAVQAFGRGAAPLVPLFRNGAAGIDEMTSKLEELGLIVSGTTLSKADALAKAFDRLSTTIGTSFMGAVVALEPVLVPLAQALGDSAVAAGKWAEKFAAAGVRVYEDWKPLIEGLKFILSLPANISEKVSGLYSGGNLVDDRARQRGIDAQLNAANRAYAAATTSRSQALASQRSEAEIRAAQKAAQQALQDDADQRFKLLEATANLEEKMARESAENAKLLARVEQEYTAGAMEGAATLATARQKEADEAWGYYNKLVLDAAEIEKQFNEEAMRGAADLSAARQKETEDAWSYYNKFVADEQKRLEKEQAELVRPFVDLGHDLFSGLDRAISTSVTGVLEGTQTMGEAFQKMGDAITLSLQETIIKRGLKQLEQALNDFLESEQFKQIIAMVTRFVGGMFAPSIAPVQNINVSPYGNPALLAAGGIVQSPTFSIVGERGPEAVIPLDRLETGGGGGGGGVTVNIIDQRKNGNIEQRENTKNSGEKSIDVIITDIVNSGLQSGSYDRAMNSSYGVARRGVSR